MPKRLPWMIIIFNAEYKKLLIFFRIIISVVKYSIRF